MDIITTIFSIVLSFFSTVVMSYVGLATPIGPWIAPTLVFIVMLFSKIITKVSTASTIYMVSAGSVGGIMATACAFSFPTLYFLDKELFNQWMNTPLFFCSILTSLSFLAGAFGFLIANASEHILLNAQNLSFPIGQLLHRMIAAHNQIRKAYELAIGFGAAIFFSFLQGWVILAQTIIPKTVTLCSATKLCIFLLPRVVVNLDIAPMIWAIGFVTGHVIALPLAVGALSSIFFVVPVHQNFFTYLSSMEFTLAFCSGIVFFITLLSMLAIPKQITVGIKNGVKKIVQGSLYSTNFFQAQNLLFAIITALELIAFLFYFKFPWHVQLYLIIGAIITTYQISAIAGRIGLALLGRFATFVMVPAMLVFNINYVHIVFIATFIEISGGVAADILFSRKLAQLSGASSQKMWRYQLLGLIIASWSIGVVFWILINHFGLGSPELCAYRAQSRQLLIQAQQFDYIVVAIGALFGLFLHYVKINPMLVLGGLLMPLDITCGLIAGGLMALFSRNKEEWYPLWSGVFAGNSICMLLRAIFT